MAKFNDQTVQADLDNGIIYGWYKWRFAPDVLDSPFQQSVYSWIKDNLHV